MESSARFPEIDATDLLEMRENNQSKNTQRSTVLKCLTGGGTLGISGWGCAAGTQTLSLYQS